MVAQLKMVAVSIGPCTPSHSPYACSASPVSKHYLCRELTMHFAKFKTIMQNRFMQPLTRANSRRNMPCFGFSCDRYRWILNRYLHLGALSNIMFTANLMNNNKSLKIKEMRARAGIIALRCGPASIAGRKFWTFRLPIATWKRTRTRLCQLSLYTYVFLK